MKRFALLDDEKVILENPIHWRNYILPVSAIATCIAGVALRLAFPTASLLNFLPPEYGLSSESMVLIVTRLEAIIMTVMVPVILVTVIDLAYTRYYVTTKRIISSAGWINVRIAEMLLERCETVSLSQRLTERIFNSGDILCVSAGASIYLNDVYNAREFRQTIMSKLVEIEQNNP